ncbi:MAG: MaoC/PaaZ C-terminal domain-containing protein [Pseudomonadota bacterium]
MDKTEEPLTFESFAVGRVFELGTMTIDADTIVAFAKAHDPQPFHLDEAEGKRVFGGLAASGWQTASLFQKHLVEGLLLKAPSLGSPGVDRLRFLKPVLAGDHLAFRATVLSARVSKSRPTVGIVTLLGEVLRAEEAVLNFEGAIMLSRSV